MAPPPARDDPVDEELEPYDEDAVDIKPKGDGTTKNDGANDAEEEVMVAELDKDKEDER